MGDPGEVVLMNRIDPLYPQHPTLGVRRLTAWLHRLGYQVNHKRVYRLRQLMGLKTIYPPPPAEPD